MRSRIGRLALALLTILAAPVAAQEIQGQKPVLLVEGAFQFTKGAWGSYVVHDKQAGEYYRLSMLVLEDETRKGQPGTWLEIDIETDAERVVTRVLVEKTPAGPGDAMAAVVWVEGLSPFSVPDKYLAGDEQQVGQFDLAQVTGTARVAAFSHDGKALQGYLAESTSADGAVTRALVSPEVAPMGLVWSDTPEMEMYLDDWGSGAQSRIEGQPMAMWLWIMDMAARGMGGEDVGIPERHLAPLDLAGAWEERDGDCAGTRWSVAGGSGSGSAAPIPSGPCGDSALQSSSWRSPRILHGTLVSGRRPGAVQMIFLSDARALLVVKTEGGAPAATRRRQPPNADQRPPRKPSTMLSVTPSAMAMSTAASNTASVASTLRRRTH